MKIKTKPLLIIIFLFLGLGFSFSGSVSARPGDPDPAPSSSSQQSNSGNTEDGKLFETEDGKYQCGKGKNIVKTKFDFGCLGKDARTNISPIEDLLYAIIRFLSVGVGIVVVISIIIAGIQYSTSEGSAEQTQAAKDRVRNAIIGLFIYLFAFALVQYLVPGGVFTSTVLTTEPTFIIERTL